VNFTDYDTRIAAYAMLVDDREQVLLTWYNGAGGGNPGWALPGGGVEYAESVEEAVIREAREETGYDVVVVAPLVVHSFALESGPRRPRPFKSVRIIYTARIAGGTLGTLEVGGTTDRAAWMPLDEAMGDAALLDISRVAITAWRQGV
jgi:8-oxo-dGTP diphosphatase